VPALTTTSYSVLALLALQPWTTYQLAKQMERSLGFIWPRAVSRLYEEPKKLVAAGLATSRPEATGRRRSTVYTITPQGRDALAAWLAEPGAGPVLECEALVKIAYADQGTRDGLLANLTALIDDTSAKLHFGDMIARQYLDGRGPFQERLPLSGLMWRFLWEYNVTVLRWARWARAEVQAWPDDLSRLDVTAEFSRIVSAATRPQTLAIAPQPPSALASQPWGANALPGVPPRGKPWEGFAHERSGCREVPGRYRQVQSVSC
jgi:PadR family transcriptional regulator AphA